MRTEGGEGDAPREEGDHARKQRARDDTQIQHGSSGTDETPSGVHACIYTNTNVHQCPYSTVIRHAPAAAHSHIRSNAPNRESRMASTRVRSAVGKSRLRQLGGIVRRKGSVCSSEPFGTLRTNDGSESILSIVCGVASRPPSDAGSLGGVVFLVAFSGGGPRLSGEPRLQIALVRDTKKVDIHPIYGRRWQKRFLAYYVQKAPARRLETA